MTGRSGVASHKFRQNKMVGAPLSRYELDTEPFRQWQRQERITSCNKLLAALIVHHRDLPEAQESIAEIDRRLRQLGEL